MTGLEMFIRYYAVISKWVFTEVQEGRAKTMSPLVSLLPGFHWNSHNQTLWIYDAELEEPDLDYPGDIDEWESYFSHCVHDPEFSPYILPILDTNREFIENYKENFLQRISTCSENPPQAFLDLVLDCLDTSYMDD